MLMVGSHGKFKSTSSRSVSCLCVLSIDLVNWPPSQRELVPSNTLSLFNLISTTIKT